jgi:hypothetical protein
MTSAESEKLQELARGKDVLEIGSLLGYSTVLLAKVARRVIAIDPHRGYPQADPKPTLAEYTWNLDRYDVRDKVTTIVGDARTILPLFRPTMFSLIFLDCTRIAAETIFLANNLDPWHLAIHDYGHPEWTGATEAIDMFFRMRSCPMEIVDTLAVLDVASNRDGYYE